MILADSSVWIDYFRGIGTPQTDRLDALLGTEPLVMGDTSDHDFNQALRPLTSLTLIDIGGQAIAIKAARNFRSLRARGATIRKTIDTLIATRCIENGYALLYSDRDFDPFVEHLGLMSALGV